VEEQMSESIPTGVDKSKKKKAVVDKQGKLRVFFSDYSGRHVEAGNTTENIERMVQFYEGREDVVMRLITYIEKYEPHLLVQAQQTLQDYLGRDHQLLSEISRWEESWANEALGFPNLAGGAAAGVAENNTSALGFPNSAGGAAAGVAENNTSALGFPNLAGGAAAGVTENNTSALGFPNSAGGAAAGVTENNASALGFPNSAGGAATGAADSARTEGLTHHPRRSSRNVASAFPNSAGGETENNTSTSGVPNSTGGAADSARTDRRSGLTHTPRRSSRRNVASMHSGPDAYTNIVKDAKTSAAKRTKRNQDNMSD